MNTKVFSQESKSILGAFPSGWFSFLVHAFCPQVSVDNCSCNIYLVDVVSDVTDKIIISGCFF